MNTDDQPKQPDAGSQAPSTEALVQVIEGQAPAAAPAPPPPPPLNVNIVVNALVQRESPEKWNAELRELMQIQREAGENQVYLFKLQRDAIIEAKERDPDYIDRRANAQSRRFLRYCVGGAIFAGIVATICLAWLHAPWGAIVGTATFITLMGTLAAGLASGGDAPTPEAVATLITAQKAVPKASPVKGVDEKPARAQPRKRGKQ